MPNAASVEKLAAISPATPSNSAATFNARKLFSGDTSSIAMLRIVSSFPAATWLSDCHA